MLKKSTVQKYSPVLRILSALSFIPYSWNLEKLCFQSEIHGRKYFVFKVVSLFCFLRTFWFAVKLWISLKSEEQEFFTLAFHTILLIGFALCNLLQCVTIYYFQPMSNLVNQVVSFSFYNCGEL